jgi:dTDP-4-amino-4,6-dideoxygalactose transaminase
MSDGPFRIRLSRPAIDDGAIARVMEVLRGHELSLGPRMHAFEAAFARRTGSPHAVAVSSGTAGLHLAVRVLGLSSPHEVITSPFSFIASANCLLFEGARPVFVDIDPDSFTLDLDAAREAVTQRTRAILPVHVFGNPVDMQALGELARRHALSVVEDACEAVGGSFQGRALGTWGDLGVFGFYPNKQMTTGEGGMVVTPRADWAERLRSLRNQGRSPSGDGSFCELGYNYRLGELAAALGEGQLERLDLLLEERRKREGRYQDLLAGLPEVRIPPIPRGRSPFVFIVQAVSHELRERLREDLLAEGIQTGVYFRPIHLEDFYRAKFGFREGQFPRAEHAGRTCLAIPFHSGITEAEQVEVAGAIRRSAALWLRSRTSPTPAIVAI